MIPAVLLSALIVQTYNGEVHVTEGLSDHACAEAKCFAEHAMTCTIYDEMIEDQMKSYERESDVWAKAHPSKMAACAKAGFDTFSCKMARGWFDPKGHWIGSAAGTSGAPRVMAPWDVRMARCVK